MKFVIYVDVISMTVKVLWMGHDKTPFTSFLHFKVLTLNMLWLIKDKFIMILRAKSKRNCLNIKLKSQ